VYLSCVRPYITRGKKNYGKEKDPNIRQLNKMCARVFSIPNLAELWRYVICFG